MRLQQTLQRFGNHFKTKRRHQPAEKRNKRQLILELLESRLAPTVSVINNFDGLVSGGPPDTTGAVGPNSYIETVNSSVAIYNKATGATIIQDGLDHFLFTVGGIIPRGGLADATMAYDEVTGQFIVGDLDVGAASASALDIAVSKTPNPTTLDGASWTFYQIDMTEAGEGADYPGNMGFNADAFVFTFNMSHHTQVAALSQSSLAAEGSVTVVRFDLGGFSMRPVTMHDSVAGGPMWFVQEGGGHNSINLQRIDNILTSHAQTTFNIGVNAYNNVNGPLNPDGSTITTNIDNRILKAAEANNLIVASHHIGVGTTEDDARWYEFNVSNINSPFLVDQGNISGGNNTYTVYPGIDINPVGDIGMSFIRSGNDTSTDFMSVYVSGRNSSDAAGTMEGPVLVRAGDSNNGNTREGDFSGINVDPNGTFWIANEFTTGGSGATEVAHFTLANPGEAFIKNGVLWVTGTNANDNVTLQLNPGNFGQTEVLDNGVDLGDFNNGSFSSVNVFLFGGNDTVNVENTLFGVPVTINEGGGNDTVNITPSAQFLDNIQGDVFINSGPGSDTLNVFDENDNFNDTWTITGSTITRTAAATIHYRGQNAVNITGGFGNLTYNILSTEFGFTTTVDTGPGTDIVNVQSTALFSPLNIENAFSTSNHDTVNIGSLAPSLGGTLANIAGTVNVSNTSGGGTTLNVDDSGDTTGQTVTVTNGSVSGTWSPASINYTGGQVTSLNLLGGDGGNTFNVQSTASGTTTSINTNDTSTASINNTVNIGSLAPSLGGTLANIAGPVNISGNSLTTVVVDDSGDTTGQSVTVTNNSISGTWAPAAINYANVSTLTIDGGSGLDTYNVQSTASGTTTDLLLQSASTVKVGSIAPSLGGTLAAIAGPLNVSNASVMAVDDSGDGTGQTATITNSSISGTWSPATITYTNLSTLSILGGSGANTFNVLSTSATTNLITNPTGVIFSGGATVKVGNAGSVQGILGALNIENPPDFNFIVVDDSADPTARTVTLSTLGTNGSDSDGNSDAWGQIIGLAPAHINYEYGDTTSLTVNGGTGGNIFAVQATAPLFGPGNRTITLNTGSGNDTVNVGNSSNVIDNIQGTLTVNGQAGTNTMNVNDQGSGGANTYTVTSSLVQRNGAEATAAINYSGLATLVLNGSSVGSTYRIDSTAAGTATTVNAQGGGNSFVVAPFSQNLGNIQGALTLNGGPGFNNLFVDDHNDPAADTYTIATGSVHRTGSVGATYTGVTFVEVNGGALGNTFNVNSTAASTPVTLNGGGGTDIFNLTASNLDPLAGAVTINGGGGTNTVNVNDQTKSGVQTYVVTATTVTRGPVFAGLTYASIQDLFLNGGTGADIYNIQSTSAATTVKGGAASDTFNVGNAGVLDGILGALTVNGAGGTNTMNVNDQNAASHTYTLTASTLTRSGSATITYFSLKSIVVNGGTGTNFFDVFATPTITVTLHGNLAGTNTLVGPNASNTFAITGTNSGTLNTKVVFTGMQNLTGGNTSDDFKFSGTGNITGNLDGGAGAGTDKLDYSALGASPIAVNLATGVASKIGGTFSNINSLVGSTATTNTLTGANTTNLWDITGLDAGKVNLFSFSAIENLVAGNVNDTFKFASSAGKVSNITGGAPAQGDWLDYSAFTSATPVTVNLLTGSATNVSGSISGIENVISGAGADKLTGNNDVTGNILIAHGGNATINGGSHRSILIGGSGNSHINGGSGGDLMIGGKTTYDTTSSGHADLMIILAEWANTALSYQTRTDDISDGTISGHAGVKLTVTLNGSSSTEFLKGSPSATDLDWFWATTSAQHSALETVSGVTELVNKDPA